MCAVLGGNMDTHYTKNAHVSHFLFWRWQINTGLMKKINNHFCFCIDSTSEKVWISPNIVAITKWPKFKNILMHVCHICSFTCSLKKNCLFKIKSSGNVRHLKHCYKQKDMKNSTNKPRKLIGTWWKWL